MTHKTDIDLEKNILVNVIEGNENAYEKLFIKYYPLLCAVAERYVDNDSAENIVQDVMLWVWENRRSLSPDLVISQYLYKAVKNRCLNLLNHNTTKNQVLSLIKEQIYQTTDSYDYAQINDLKEKITQAVNELPQAYREAFEMNRYEGKTYNEIAEKLGVSPKTIDYRICQSIKLLRNKLKNFL